MQAKLLVAFIALGLTVSAQAAPTIEEMWEVIKQQQAEIERLTAKQGVAETKRLETEQKIEATADMLEAGGSAMTSVAQWASKTSIGGYGELHYNKLDASSDVSDVDKIDLHRFVLFFGHQFTDSVRFFSELEVEHSIAGEGKKGEVELEQAYVEWDYAANQRAKVGLFLVPVGIINDTHEPDTFYGVERNSVEKNIIPATWWEAGVASSGELAQGWSYDVAVHSGLYLNQGAKNIRKGRQKVSNAKADDYAYTARLKYTGISGLELAASLQYQTDLFQSETEINPVNMATVGDVSALLYELHAVYSHGEFGVRALYAAWEIDDAINVYTSGADKQEGLYIEPSYRINNKFGVFARYSQWDNTAASSADSEYSQIDVGVNYWLAPTVVLKADYQIQNAPAGKVEFDGINLGLGWSF